MAVVIDSPFDLAHDIIRELEGRKGFDDWWDWIDYDVQREVIEALEKVIENY
jgi:hypothetical protein